MEREHDDTIRAAIEARCLLQICYHDHYRVVEPNAYGVDPEGHPVLLAHLLKWQFLPSRRSKSWQFTIRTQRKEVAYVLDEAPSLRSKFSDAAWLDIVWSKARSAASNETGLDLDAFPESLPWPIDDVLSQEFHPE